MWSLPTTTTVGTCKETRQIVDEVVALSPKITADYHNLSAETDVAKLYGVDRAPAIAILLDAAPGEGGPLDYGIRYYGIPSGYEFQSLLGDIEMVSTGKDGLSLATRAWLSTLDQPVHLQVFVTPTCPYCAPMVQLAHRLALASDHVRADMVEAMEFPELADRYGVYGVPRTVINEDTHIEGAVPEARLLAEIRKALGEARVASTNARL